MSERKASEIPVLLLYNLDPAWSEAERQEVDTVSAQLAEALNEEGHPTEAVRLENDAISAELERSPGLTQVVFNWCEGYPGLPHSEHIVAADLEKLGCIFTGADAAVIELAQNKKAVKSLLLQTGIPTPEGQLCTHPTAVNGWNRYPAIVKTANEHCSEGLDRNSVVTDATELKTRVEYIIDTFKQPALIEDFIDGREFHVSIIGNGRLEMLPPAEMDFSAFSDFHDHLCSYEAKFAPESVHYNQIQTLLPAPLSESESRELEQVCLAAYKAVGCRDYGRIDVRLRDGIFYVLDVNPNSDMSPDTSTACAAELAGYTYGGLGSRIVGLAMNRSLQ